MAIATSYGYDGSVSEAAWPILRRAMVSRYGVHGSGDWRVTAKPAADRTVRIAAGWGWGEGVTDYNDEVVELQHAIAASGTRYDMVVAHRDWNTNTTSFAIIEGGSSPLALPTRDTAPGDEDDQPIALVPIIAGQSQPGPIVDLRVWAADGGMQALDDRALQYLGHPGSRVRIGLDDWVCQTTGSSSAWERWRAPKGEIRDRKVGGAQSNIKVATAVIDGGAIASATYARILSGYGVIRLTGITPGTTADAVITWAGNLITANEVERTRLPSINASSPYAVGGGATVPFDIEIPAGQAVRPRLWIAVLNGNATRYVNIESSALLFRLREKT